MKRLLAMAALQQKIICVDVFQISGAAQKPSNDWSAAIGTSEQEHMSEAQNSYPEAYKNTRSSPGVKC